jgi:hydroxyacylglutathione hydrolase
VFLKRFFEPTLAQTSYVIGCATAGEALVIDPNRDLDQYIKAAEAEGARVAHVTETHIHADYVSGSRELAARTGATLYLSDEGDADWKYGYAREAHAVLVREGDRITVGRVRVDVAHTPGHTPEHLSFLVTDCTAANDPIGAATGDFIFVGDVGRPDLLERAANLTGTMEAGARTLYRSLQRWRDRPDWLQIWPGHGAGSACGKGISAIPQSTLGYEKRFNWAFRAASEDDFVRSVLAGQPEPPKYFAEMKHVNKAGPRLLGGFHRPPLLQADALARLVAAGACVVDTRHAADFAIGHVPGTINIPLNAAFTTWAGWLLPYDADVHLIAGPRNGEASRAVDAAVRDLAMIGLDRVAGWFDDSVIDAWTAAGRPPGSVPQITVDDLAEALRHDAVTLVDVRSAAEWATGWIAGARHIPLGYLTDELDQIPRARPVVVQCQSGSRSAIGASLLRAHGFAHVANLPAGISGWVQRGLAVEAPDP